LQEPLRGTECYVSARTDSAWDSRAHVVGESGLQALASGLAAVRRPCPALPGHAYERQQKHSCQVFVLALLASFDPCALLGVSAVHKAAKLCPLRPGRANVSRYAKRRERMCRRTLRIAVHSDRRPWRPTPRATPLCMPSPATTMLTVWQVQKRPQGALCDAVCLLVGLRHRCCAAFSHGLARGYSCSRRQSVDHCREHLPGCSCAP
jgi:hypothetical protein